MGCAQFYHNILHKVVTFREILSAGDTNEC